ncbi:unnamed protein product, partial [Mesorhabditis belari]|uniref:Uncharacterized protein n=1 Tax=Mesorhabditis belari TaxID=2138241 RepID=A0AAF3J690_9BILA
MDAATTSSAVPTTRRLRTSRNSTARGFAVTTNASRKNIRDEEENTYEPENEIVMVEREGKTCFSMEEQPKCQPGDELIETENRKVKLACLPRSDRRTRRMVNGLKRGEESIMEEIRSLPMSLTDRIELPKLCRVY